MLILDAEPLTRQAFAPYGTVSERPATIGPQTVERAFERDSAAALPLLQIVHGAAAPSGFMTIGKIEHHPFAAQTFLSLSGAPSLIVVCDADASGNHNPATLRAFIASGSQAVTYGRCVWHHSLTPLEEASTFAMVMAQTGRNDDTVIVPLANAVQVRLPISR